MPKPDSLQGSLDLLVLKILSRRPRLHGYGIMSAIKESSGDVLRADEGSLYPALHRMEENRWIHAEWITKDTGRRARIYELTATGKKQLADEDFGWRKILKRKVTSAAAVLSLALAIGSCDAAFRLLDAMLWRPLPIAAPERLYALSREFAFPDGKVVTGDNFEYPMFRQMR